MVLPVWEFVAVRYFVCLSDFALYWILGWVLPILLHAAKFLKTAFILAWTCFSVTLLILLAFVVGCFFSPKEWQMVNLSPISFDEQCVLFWSLLFIFMLFIGLAAGFIISNYNNFQVHWDKSFPTWRGDFWLAVRESARGGVVTPHQLESESAVGNQAALTCSECVNRFSLCQA